MVADEMSLLEGAEKLLPALVVVDASLAQVALSNLLKSIRIRAPAAKVLLLSLYDSPTVVDAAFAAGADGLVLKRALATDLLPAVDALLAGSCYVSPACAIP
jgi:two-component system secretion response regulator SsrB